MVQENLLLTYHPLPKQQIFHEAGKRYIERLLLAGNQYGKTYCACAELAIHAQGAYDDLPFEWIGRRWNRPVTILVIGHDFEQMRDSCQKHLFGMQGNWGTGLIQKSSIDEKSPKMSREKPGCVSLCYIKSNYGGNTLFRLASESQGVEAIMGGQWDIILFDEMPQKKKMLSQALARTTWTSGMIMIAATAEKGHTDITDYFLEDEENEDMKHRFYIIAGADENPFLSKEHTDKLWSGYSREDYLMRVKGEVLYGTGLIYPYSEDSFLVDPFPLPVEWKRLCSVDPGYENSWTSLLFGAISPDDTVYFHHLIRRKRKNCKPALLYPLYHTQCIQWTGNPNTKIPMAYPKDANQHGRTGIVIANEYRKVGFQLVRKPASVKLIDGKISHGVWDGITFCQCRFDEGKVKIFKSPVMEPFVKELRRYSTDEDGEIIQKTKFDVLDTMRYLLTSLKYASYGGNGRCNRSVKVIPTCSATNYH